VNFVGSSGAGLASEKLKGQIASAISWFFQAISAAGGRGAAGLQLAGNMYEYSIIII
jgi:hypothetical protein